MREQSGGGEGDSQPAAAPGEGRVPTQRGQAEGMIIDLRTILIAAAVCVDGGGSSLLRLR